MKLMRQFVITAVAAGSVLLPVGGALADTVMLDAAGPGSNQDVTINNSNSVVETNVNSIVVTNSNSQVAVTGDVTAKDNTSVGNVSSGSATNTNGTSTTVTVENTPAVPVQVPVGGVGGSTGGKQPGSGSTPAGGSGQSAGSVLGSSTTAGGMGGGAAMLPVTGPSQPVDVSALRAAWQSFASAPQAAAVQQSRTSSLFMFMVATLLAVLGGLGNAVYLRRKEGRG